MRDAGYRSLEELLGQIRRDAARWSAVWFRGEPDTATALIPRVYRPRLNGGHHAENRLLQSFRMRAPTFALGNIPDRTATDQWLFLAQHVGLPTRLLDWTEGAMVALHFALLEESPVVWMLNPLELNRLSMAPGGELPDEFPLTWFSPPDGTVNIGSINIRGAWEKDVPGVELPVAVQSTNTHPRMSVQRSCFTVHGKNKGSLAQLVPGEHLKRYEIEPACKATLRQDLVLLGIDHATVFPDLDGLARELRERF